MNIIDIVLPESKDGARALITRLQEQEVGSLVTDRLKKNGEVVRVSLTLTRLLGEEGLPEFIASTERDFATFNKEAEFLLAGGGHGKG